MKDITIHPQVTIKEAMEAMGETTEKVLLVVDNEQRLIGALTDGDIRRYIPGGGDLSGTIQGVYKTNPIFVFRDDYHIERIKQILVKNRIGLIPILHKNRKMSMHLTPNIYC